MPDATPAGVDPFARTGVRTFAGTTDRERPYCLEIDRPSSAVMDPSSKAQSVVRHAVLSDTTIRWKA